MIGLNLSREEMKVISSFGYREADGRNILSIEAVSMYVCLLRTKMDFKTGLIGDVSPISIGGLSRKMALNRGSSSRGGAVLLSVGQVRRCLRECEMAGLLERREHSNPNNYTYPPLLFFARLAGCDSFRPNEVERVANTCAPTKVEHCGQVGVAHENKGLEPSGDCKVERLGQHYEPAEVQHISAQSAHTTSNTKYISGFVDNFHAGDNQPVINTDWEVDQEAINYLCSEYGFDESFLMLESAGFCLYWCERGGGCSDWNVRFVRHVEYRLLREREPRFLLAARGKNNVA